MSKAAEAFRTISEVADELDVQKHVLRFWEARFPQVRPMKRGGGRRYYRPEDMELLRGIRHLLHAEGYTIKGVQKILREQGIEVGLVKLRLFRPFPFAALRAALADIPEVIVLDRNYSPGSGGVLHQELRAALCGVSDAPVIRGLLAGVGGVNVPPERIIEFVRDSASYDSGPETVWAS